MEIWRSKIGTLPYFTIKRMPTCFCPGETLRVRSCFVSFSRPFYVGNHVNFPGNNSGGCCCGGPTHQKKPPQFIKVQQLMDVNGTQKESLQMGFNNRGWHFIHIFSSQCHWGQDDRSSHLAYWEGNLRERSTRVAEPQSHLWVLLGFTSRIFPYRAHFTHEALVAAVGESRWNWQRSLWLYHLPGAATVSWLWAVARVRTWDEGRHSLNCFWYNLQLRLTTSQS